MNSKIIATDFDNVLHDLSDGFKDGMLYGQPIKGAREALSLLIDQGYTPVVFTTRKDLKAVAIWLRDNEFPMVEVTNTKPIAKFYIDDRGLRFTAWADMLRYIL